MTDKEKPAVSLCVWCGHKEESESAVQREIAITDHVITCIKHPLGRAVAEINDGNALIDMLNVLVAVKDRQLAECTKVMREVATELREWEEGAIHDDPRSWIDGLIHRLMAARAGK